MAKEIETYVKLQVPAGQASPSPPVGPALGQHGLPLMDFCNAFNARTKDLEQGLPCPVVITVYEDKSFDFIIKTTPASVLIKKAAGFRTFRDFLALSLGRRACDVRRTLAGVANPFAGGPPSRCQISV